jgi:hypothetical protein
LKLEGSLRGLPVSQLVWLKVKFLIVVNKEFKYFTLNYLTRWQLMMFNVRHFFRKRSKFWELMLFWLKKYFPNYITLIVKRYIDAQPQTTFGRVWLPVYHYGVIGSAAHFWAGLIISLSGVEESRRPVLNRSGCFYIYFSSLFIFQNFFQIRCSTSSLATGQLVFQMWSDWH